MRPETMNGKRRAKSWISGLAVIFLVVGCASGANASPTPSTAASAALPVAVATPRPSSNPPGQMAVERGLHTATLLPDGRVLIAGGFATGPHALSSAEIFDPTAGTFSPAAPMATGRAAQTATLLADGRVLLTGGSSDNWNVFLASAEIYNPSTGTFSSTGRMAASRADLDTATLLTDGRVLVTGGQGDSNLDLSSAEVWDPKSGGFGPTGPMMTGRAGQTATLLADGRVLVYRRHPRQLDLSRLGRVVRPEDRHVQPDRLDEGRSLRPHGHAARRRPCPHCGRHRRLGRVRHPVRRRAV